MHDLPPRRGGFPFLRRCTIAKAIMIQGTMSSAGKSLLCAGLCRIFHQDGFRVAPFKSQNMALNSYITADGLEMGRAQAVQAEAACREPGAQMNPTLLKPVRNMGSQVIVMGKVLGNMSAREYYAKKHTLLPHVLEAYRALDADNDILVIEGAGSPAEINLREGDFVNMGMARIANAPVLLAGDIDRGGVFAQLYGTIALLEEAERQQVKAMIINKFRGDARLLESGLSMLRSLTGKPVAGVVPFLDVDIDEEDSLADRLRRTDSHALLDIAVIRLPRLSNFTDFSALEAAPEAGVRYVRSLHELGSPDLLILPGTKNTIEDLLWLRQSGLEGAIQRLAAENTPILGICGGYQMLGEWVSDPAGAEGGGEAAGMGLLPVTTELTSEKRRTRTSGRILETEGALEALSGTPAEGYEIHMGRTTLEKGARPLIRLESGTSDGCQAGHVYGTYLHGFFDSDILREALLQALCRRKGCARVSAAFDLKAYKEQQYDRLADALRTHLDLPLIYSILQKGGSEG